MRIYLPATSADLSRPAGVPPRWGHAVTAELRRALPDEEEEALEATAMMAAADESIVHLRASSSAVPRRVVIAADISESAVVVPERARPWRVGDDQLPSAVDVRMTVPWADVASIHVDGPAATEDVAAAVDDDDALDRAAEHDLLWHDIVEREVLARELRR
ncbi:DUF6912 family protein [Georgenia sp. H159]|uniref:DUF6912 family protein n=1 Tax=Georgenia sp. H159 TaxID=3076115 RepID=UPI002D781F84|nr:hypothetical protein [Georgenia sp. H159]